MSSRWYAGFGINRDVRISILNSVHIGNWGVSVTTPLVSNELAKVRLAVQIKNGLPLNKDLVLKTEIIGSNNAVVANHTQNLIFDATKEILPTFDIDINKPKLWDTETPNMYKAKVSIWQNRVKIDEYTLDFGIRSISFSVDKGFLLNGKALLLKGACMHHDNGLLGAAAFKDAEYRRVELMKRNGFNAIRTSHNPPSEHFLDACDKLGILVINEAFDMWEQEKRKNDYHLYFNSTFLN
jgi:beta-galactosidase